MLVTRARETTPAKRVFQRAFGAVLLLIAINAAVYHSVAASDFLNWDDYSYVVDNAQVKSFDVPAIFTSFVVSGYQPLTSLSYAVEYRLVGLQPLSFHLVNLAIHILVAIAVFFFFRRLLGRELPSLLVAVLFSVHPLNVESVAWVSERKGLLSALFLVAALISYLHHAEDRTDKKWYALSLGLGLAAMLAKSSAVILPLLMLLVDWFRGERWAGRIKEKWPWFLLGALFGVVNLFAQKTFRSTVASEHYDLLMAPVQYAKSLVFYAVKAFVPWPQSAFYPVGLYKIPSWFFAAFFILGAGAIWAGRRFKNQRRPVLFGFFFFVIVISLVTKAIPFGCESLYNERYFYVAGVGILFAIVSLVLALGRGGRARSVAAAFFLGVVIAACSWTAHSRLGVWKNGAALWEDTARKNPDSPSVLNNAGGAMVRKKEYQEAEKFFRAALEKNPNFVPVLDSLGLLMIEQERYEEARPFFEKMAKIEPSSVEAHVDLARALSGMGEKDEALRELEVASALAKGKERWDVETGYGFAHSKGGDMQRAIERFQRAAEIVPSGKSYYNLGYALKQDFQIDAAIEHLERALRLDPESADTHFELAEIYFRQQRYDLAIARLDRAKELGLEIDPKVLEEVEPHRRR